MNRFVEFVTLEGNRVATEFVETEEIVLASDELEYVEACRELIRKDWLSAQENASLECMLDELESRGYDILQLYPE